MSAPTDVPPAMGVQKTISYELTRWDLLVNWMTVLFRNRILQVFVLLGLLFNIGLALVPKLGTYSIVSLIFLIVVYFVGFFGFLIFFLTILGLANAFLPKHRGVLGRHVLESKEEGLVERTDYNETLHRWPSIVRVLSLWGYVYIYVTDSNAHVVPRRCFPPAEIDSFVADVRRRAKQASS